MSGLTSDDGFNVLRIAAKIAFFQIHQIFHLTCVIIIVWKKCELLYCFKRVSDTSATRSLVIHDHRLLDSPHKNRVIYVLF